MAQALEIKRPVYFEASMADLKAQAEADGWSFWRGVTVGFLASFPIAQIAATGGFFGLI